MRSVAFFALVPVLAMAAAFFVSALCEELGWSAYAVDALRERCGALGTTLIVGVVWAVWHWPALLQAHRALSWIAWWSLATVAARVIMAAGAVVIAVTWKAGRARPDGPAAGAWSPQMRE